MATPTSNSVDVSAFPRAPGNDGALQYGVKWGVGYGVPVVLTYSFPSGKAWFVDGYAEYQSWYALNSPEKSAVRAALTEWASVANLKFVKVADGENLVGELRFAITDNAGKEAAHAYFPSTSPSAGDVWFKNGGWHKNLKAEIKKGSYDYLVVLHEIGHAVGLKHPFEEPQKLQKAYDHYAYTIMSYSAYPFSGGDNYASFYPTTPMYYDLVNIQGMYGRGVHNPGNTVYIYKDGKKYWETIDDSGGIDTIVHKGETKAVIDLNIGGWSTLGKAIKFSVGSTKKTVAIGPGTVIENATGGKGKDILIGNDVANVLSGGKGKDVLTGGGAGDTFLFTAKLGSRNADTIKDFVSGVDRIALKQKVAKALDKGVVSAEAFEKHFDYDNGSLTYHSKAIAKLAGAPVLDAGDLFVV